MAASTKRVFEIRLRFVTRFRYRFGAILMRNQTKINRQSVVNQNFHRNRLSKRSWERFGLDFRDFGVLGDDLGRLFHPQELPKPPQGGPWHVPGRAKSTPGGENRARNCPSRPNLVEKGDLELILDRFLMILVDFWLIFAGF